MQFCSFYNVFTPSTLAGYSNSKIDVVRLFGVHKADIVINTESQIDYKVYVLNLYLLPYERWRSFRPKIINHRLTKFLRTFKLNLVIGGE